MDLFFVVADFGKADKTIQKFFFFFFLLLKRKERTWDEAQEEQRAAHSFQINGPTNWAPYGNSKSPIF